MDTSLRKNRILGGILVLAGVLLSGGMGWLIYWLGDVIAHPGVRGHWNGGPEFTEATFRLFYSVFAFGLTSLGAGLFQGSTGRRNKLLLAPIFLSALWLLYAL